ncbi:MAG TPA: DUF6011 domain-containing protein [Trebonia sp.]|jgi:hypothetical protein
MTNATETAPELHRCLRCGRPIRSAEAIASGYGSGCRAKVRKASKQADLAAWTPSQVESAREALEDGAVVPSTRVDVFHVVSSDGTEVHLTHRDGCNCTAGLKTHHPRPCWHRAAVAIVLAADTAAVPAARLGLAA